MPGCSLEELKEAFGVFCRVGNECAERDDYNAFADLFTEDCLYVEHFYGTMHGREEVRKWIVPLMREYPMTEMVRYKIGRAPCRERRWIGGGGGAEVKRQVEVSLAP